MHSQFLNRICARHVSVWNSLLYLHIVFSFAIDFNLQAGIQLVSTIFHTEFLLHRIDLTFDKAHRLDKLGAIPIDSIELSEHRIQTSLQRVVVNCQLAKIVVRSFVDWTNCRDTSLWSSYKAMGGVTGVNIPVRTSWPGAYWA